MTHAADIITSYKNNISLSGEIMIMVIHNTSLISSYKSLTNIVFKFTQISNILNISIYKLQMNTSRKIKILDHSQSSIFAHILNEIFKL